MKNRSRNDQNSHKTAGSIATRRVGRYGCTACGIDLRDIETDPRRSLPYCHLLVLDVDGHVRAAAYLVLARVRGLRGRLEFLVLDPAVPCASTRAIQDRVTGVALALCEAYGCTSIDVAATSRNDVAASRQALAACAR